MSYRGVLNWGLMACAETVPRLADLALYIPDAIDELASAAKLAPTRPVGVAPGRPQPSPVVALSAPHPRSPHADASARTGDGATGVDEGRRPLRVGLVGCGMIGQIHADGLRKLAEDGEVVTVGAADPSEAVERRRRRATAPSST